MLAIRLQRRGRKGHAQFRMIVQESRLSPKSERVVANLGSYDPHTKLTTVDTEKAAFYLEHGAQPSDRVARILKNEKVKLPEWVKIDGGQSRTTRNPEKLRKNQPAEPKTEQPAEKSDDEPTEEVAKDDETAVESPADETKEKAKSEDEAEKPADAAEDNTGDAEAEKAPAEAEKSDDETKADKKEVKEADA